MHGPARGKIERETFDGLIRSRIGAARPEVLVGPRHGTDAGIVDIGDGSVMSVTTDPFFVMPEIGWERAGWFAVHIVASDAATSGLAPRYMAVDLNLPVDMSTSDLDSLWASVHSTCEALGIAIVTGHTGWYDGCAFPMIGSATAIAVGSANAYVTPAMVRPGDVVVVTKGAAIETTAMFGAALGPRLRRDLGREVATRVESLFKSMTVVHDAMTAISVGVRDDGVTSMHDATEGGVWGGLREIAEAANTGLVVHTDDVYVAPEVRAVCDLFGIDPLPASSEGTLLITCRPHTAQKLIDRLGAADLLATCVGEIVPAEEDINVVEAGRCRPMESRADPFWPAITAALREESAR